MNISLSKKTKAELISAYEDLLAQQKELETTAQQCFIPERSKEIEEAEKTYTVDAIQKTITSLQAVAGSAITEFARSFEVQVRRFEELQKMSAHLEERLKLLRNLEAGAETGAQLIATLESERTQLENEITIKRRDWEREREEAEYRAKTASARRDAEVAEEYKKKETVLKEREQMLAVREKELAEQVKRLENYDMDVEKDVSKRLAEAHKEWGATHARALAEKERERELDEKLHEIQIKELTADVKRLENEVVALRKDTVDANKRAQDLALKIVESTSRIRANILPAGEEK